MGLFDIFKKKPQASKLEVMQVQSLMNQLQDSVQLLNTTTVPKTFFGRLHFALDVLLELQKYEKYGLFQSSTPTQDYNKIIGNLEATVNDFIDRAIIAHVEKNELLNSQAEKDKKFDKFIENLWHSFYEADTYWAGNSVYPHYSGKLFTDANFQRVEELHNDVVTKRIETQYQSVSAKTTTAKKRSTKPSDPKPSEKLQTIYFRNGAMYKILYGSKENWYDAKFLVSDGVLYDLENVADLQSIPTPSFDKQNPASGKYGVTGSLDYVMRMKAGNLRNKGMIPESDECYKKAIDLMFNSGIFYDIKPYLYFTKDLLREGRFEESEYEENRANKLYQQKLNEGLWGHQISVQEDGQKVRPYITQEDREYYRIKYMLPEHAPKSISGYTRMKNARSTNFMKLAEIAKENGIEIQFDSQNHPGTPTPNR